MRKSYIDPAANENLNYYQNLVCFPSKGKVIHLHASDITHISIIGSDTFVFTGHGAYRSDLTPSKLMFDLPSSIFVRVHRSHIVSLFHMKFEHGTLQVGDLCIQVSSKYKLALRVKLMVLIDDSYQFYKYDIHPLHRRRRYRSHFK